MYGSGKEQDRCFGAVVDDIDRVCAEPEPFEVFQATGPAALDTIGGNIVPTPLYPRFDTPRRKPRRAQTDVDKDHLKVVRMGPRQKGRYLADDNTVSTATSWPASIASANAASISRAARKFVAAEGGAPVASRARARSSALRRKMGPLGRKSRNMLSGPSAAIVVLPAPLGPATMIHAGRFDRVIGSV